VRTFLFSLSIELLAGFVSSAIGSRLVQSTDQAGVGELPAANRRLGVDLTPGTTVIGNQCSVISNDNDRRQPGHRLLTLVHY